MVQRFKQPPFVLPILSLAALIFGIYTVIAAQKVAPPPPPVVDPPRNPYPSTIAGAGIIEPASERAASIGPAEPGVVLKLHVKVGDAVASGAPLFQIDDRALQAERKVREAALGSARARLARLEALPRPEEVPPLAAAAEGARATLGEHEGQLERLEKAWKAHPGSVAADLVETRRWQVQAARDALARAEAELALLKAGAWEYEVREARGEAARAEAALAQIETEIERRVVRAPSGGTVLQVNLREGEYASPSGEAMVVFGDLSSLHVRVDVDEESAPLVRAGQKAVAVLRGFPRNPVPLEFVRVEPYVAPKKSLTGDNDERVDTRVLQVIFRLGKTELSVYVGQQVDVFIDRGER